MSIFEILGRFSLSTALSERHNAPRLVEKLWMIDYATLVHGVTRNLECRLRGDRLRMR